MRIALKFILLPLLCVAFSNVVHAGGGPHNTLVLVNDQDADSLELGNYYAAARGIPSHQILHLDVPTEVSLSTNSFETVIMEPLRDYLAHADAGAQIRFIAVCWTNPHQVSSMSENFNGLSTAIFYGYQDAPSPSGGICPDLNPEAQNPYFASEEAFSRLSPSAAGTGTGCLATMLTAYDRVGAQQLIDRSVAADGTRPPGSVHLLHSGDTDRNVRWPQFENAHFRERLLPGGTNTTWEIPDAWSVSGKTNIVGYAAGSASVANLAGNTFLPGALGDHLTSFGGQINGPAGGQMNILEWLAQGCVGSYGTVMEPCNYTNQFPEVQAYYGYERGFNMAESYMMSLESPYRGIVVGDPLCQPYAQAAQVQLQGVAPESIVAGTLSLSGQVQAVDAMHPISRLELLVDGIVDTTLLDLPPTVGDQVSVTVGSRSRSYTVQTGDALADVASGLASVMERRLYVNATARPDQIDFTSTIYRAGAQGSIVDYSVSTASAKLRVQAAGTHLLDCAYPARKQIVLEGSATAAGTISLTLTRMDGASTNLLVNVNSNETSATVLQRVMNTVNANLFLQDPNGCSAKYRRSLGGTRQEAFLVANSPTWNSYNLRVSYSVNADGFTSNHNLSYRPFDSNSDVMASRGVIYLASGETTITHNFSFDTSTLPDGPHQLQLVATEGTAAAVQSYSAPLAFTVSNQSLTCSISAPHPDQQYVQGEPIPVEASVTSPGATVTNLTLMAEGKPVMSSSQNPLSYLMDSSYFPPGDLLLQVRVRDSLGRETWSAIRKAELLPDRDNDLIDDLWETAAYGDIALYDGDDDPDADGDDTRYEYLVDTHPTNATSKFTMALLPPSTPGSFVALKFPSSSNRLYQVEINDEGLTILPAWTPVQLPGFTGSGGLETWFDDGLSYPAPTNSFRHYRVRITRP